MTSVTVERCMAVGIYAEYGGSVELTGCTLRHNNGDYRKWPRGRGSSSSIVVDGSAR